MGSKFRISVKFKLNYFILHFRKISLMRYDELDLYCLLPESTKIFKYQGFIRGKEEANSG